MDSVTLELSTAATFVFGAVGALIGVLLAANVWFIQRELRANDQVHKEMQTGIGDIRDSLGKVAQDVAYLRGATNQSGPTV